MSKELMQIRTAVMVACVTSLLAGCLEDAQTDEPIVESETTAEQAINEINCNFNGGTNVSVRPDFSCQVPPATPGHFNTCSKTSPNESYGHALCQNAWIGDVEFGGRGEIDVFYSGGVLADNTVFPCEAMWVRRIVIVQGLTRIDNIAQGTGTTHCVAPRLEPLVVAPGAYRVLSQAGIITSYAKVNIRFNGSFR